MLRNPKVFISYSRDKIRIAEFLKDELEQKGYYVFFDKETIKVGDSFPNRIQNFLKICDGVIVLISNSSIKSEWCKYEYHYSYFKKKIIIPIVVEQLENGLKNPLTYFQKDINYVYLDNSSHQEIQSILLKINDKLNSVRSVAQKKMLKYFFGAISLIFFLFLIFQFGVKKINSHEYKQERAKLLQKIETNKHIYTKNEIKEISTKFSNDLDLAGSLYILSSNDKVSSYARLNSSILIGQLMSNYSLFQKNKIENIYWNNSLLFNNQLTDKSFLKCKIENVQFNKTNLLNVSFTQSILSNLSFLQSNFAGVLLNPKEASVLDFTGCKFFGCTIELTNFLKVSFQSRLSNDRTIVDTSFSTFFENCLFESRFQKDERNSIDFTRIEAVKFKNVNFSNCNFRGYLDKDWFYNCGFYNCTFTDQSIVPELIKNNFIE